MLAAIIAHWVFQPLHGDGYQFWSGAGSDIGEITIPLAFGAWVIHHNCRKPHCLRLGHAHPDHGQPLCSRHHDHDPTVLRKR